MKEKTTSLNSQPQALKKSFKIKNDVGGIERERGNRLLRHGIILWVGRGWQEHKNSRKLYIIAQQ